PLTISYVCYKGCFNMGAATHTPVLAEQPPGKRWRGIEAPQMKGPQRCRVHLVPGGTRKNHAHERIDELLMLGNDRTVRDRFEQRRGLLQRLLHLDRE